MELKEGLEFYRKCLEHCDMVIAIEIIEELLR